MSSKPKLDDLLAAQTKRPAYRGAELGRIREEQDLTIAELADILHCSRRAVHMYLTDEEPMLSCRWRLLRLELGLERPAWTEQWRITRMTAEFLGGDA